MTVPINAKVSQIQQTNRDRSKATPIDTQANAIEYEFEIGGIEAYRP